MHHFPNFVIIVIFTIKEQPTKNIKTSISIPGNCEGGASPTSSLDGAHVLKSKHWRQYKEFLYQPNI